MVNKTNKGNRYELEARKLLSAEGYLVEKKNYSRWESNDFWGLFDILAIHPTGEVVHQEISLGDTAHAIVSKSKIRLVQVKTNRSDFYKARSKIQEWVDENKISGIDCEVWLREPRKAWRQEKVTSQD